jgi:hypothetical protein
MLLQEATLQDIYDELRKRYSILVLATTRESKNKEAKSHDTEILYAGGCVQALGLATAARIHVSMEFAASCAGDDDDG